jgi:hypothetical protein
MLELIKSTGLMQLEALGARGLKSGSVFPQRKYSLLVQEWVQEWNKGQVPEDCAHQNHKLSI